MNELAGIFDDVDFHVETDDFLLYELGRLLEEDRVSFEDEEFRRIIDEGVHEHIEERLDIRAEMAKRLRAALAQIEPAMQRIGRRTLQTIEDIESPLHNASLVVGAYTAYMFRRLQDTADEPKDRESEARTLIQRWQNGEILREQMMARLKEVGRPAVGP